MKFLLVIFFVLFSIFSIAQNGKYMGQVKINPIPSGQSLNFNIMSGNPSTAFKIDSKTGQIFINNQTAINSHGWDYTLSIRLRYSKNNVIQKDSLVNFKITSQYSKLVNEIKVNPVPVGQSINFNIQSGNPSTAFTIDPNVGSIFINNQSAIDSYTWRYNLVVRLRYSTKINGVSVILADTLRTIRILNLTNGRLIGKMIASDPDNVPVVKQTISFYFMSGNYSTAFKINGTTGDITVNNVSAINTWMVTNDRYILNVRAKDNGTPNYASYANGTILLFGGIPRKDVFNCRYPY
jgi:hypothetical protein